MLLKNNSAHETNERRGGRLNKTTYPPEAHEDSEGSFRESELKSAFGADADVQLRRQLLLQQLLPTTTTTTVVLLQN